jgi:hypothetical protein
MTVDHSTITINRYNSAITSDHSTITVNQSTIMSDHSDSNIMVDHRALSDVPCGALDFQGRPRRSRAVSSGGRLEDRGNFG